MTSYRYRKSHCGDRTVIRSSYLHNGISYTGKMTSLYWIRAQGPSPLHIKMSYYQCRDFHYKDKMVVRPFYLIWKFPYLERLSLYWDRALVHILWHILCWNNGGLTQIIKVEQLERLRSEIPLAAPWLPILVIHGRTDRRTDRRMGWNQYTPLQLRCAGV